ncbi:hypothetical protein MSAN_01143900 [Mycena sanguinolenta]|uniref:Uncharacterized protein n=1 Tax=Mycena sanguinolenta TaxID=230812 RepID=A0A8H7D6Y0_9AGAR|nr:hypothetical protein MSAN_01143900 [Mycena sanguinolenta]
MPSYEYIYAELIFRTTGKYAAWDPEIPMKVGDYGRITRGSRGLAFWRRNGTFVREGNIYTDGMVDGLGIPAPVEYGADSEGETWVTCSEITTVDLSLSAGGVYPPLGLGQLQAGASFKCASGRGAMLVMKNTAITAIEHPDVLRRLLADPRIAQGMVVVSEVHSCSSYARLLTTNRGDSISLGLHVEPSVPGIPTAALEARWEIENVGAQNIKFQVNKNGERTFYPLFRLVSLSERRNVYESLLMKLGKITSTAGAIHFG